MSTQYDVQNYMRTILQTDVALTAWLAATFGKTLTVLLGNRKNQVVKSQGFPSASIIFGPKEVKQLHTGEPAYLVEDYMVDMGLYFEKASTLDDTHLQHIAEFERLVALALLSDRRMGGLSTNLNITHRQGDENVNHPFHFFTIIFQIERTAPY